MAYKKKISVVGNVLQSIFGIRFECNVTLNSDLVPVKFKIISFEFPREISFNAKFGLSAIILGNAEFANIDWLGGLNPLTIPLLRISLYINP